MESRQGRAIRTILARRASRPGGRRGLLVAVVVLACLSAPLHAQSQRFSGEIALSSQLVDLGLAITPATPVLQGAVSWQSPGGWSLGLAGGVEVRSPGQPVMILARGSRSWAISGDWMAQASLLYYDYRAASGRALPDRADANLYFSYRDILTMGVSAIRVGGDRDRRLFGAADVDASYPVTPQLSLSAGAGIAQAAVGSGYAHGHAYDGYGRASVLLYGYGSLGLAWSGGPWRVRFDRNMSSLGERRVYGVPAASDWVATVSRSF